jgi:hypothetical protein
MKSVFVILCLVCLKAAESKAQAIHEIARGEICFFKHEQHGRSAFKMGAATVFNSIDEVYASLNPLPGLRNIHQGRNAYLVELSVNGHYRMEVEVALPQIEYSQRVLTFPVFPHRNGNSLPQLPAAITSCLKGETGRHWITMRVFLKQGRVLLGAGEFSVDALIWMRRLE